MYEPPVFLKKNLQKIELNWVGGGLKGGFSEKEEKDGGLNQVQHEHHPRRLSHIIRVEKVKILKILSFPENIRQKHERKIILYFKK